MNKIKLTIANDLVEVLNKDLLKDIKIDGYHFDVKARDYLYYTFDFAKEEVYETIEKSGYSVMMNGSYSEQIVNMYMVVPTSMNDRLKSKEPKQAYAMTIAPVCILIRKSRDSETYAYEVDIIKNSKMNPIVIKFGKNNVKAYTMGKRSIGQLTTKALTYRLSNLYSMYQFIHAGIDRSLYEIIKPFVSYSNHYNDAHFKLENKYTYLMMKAGYLLSLENAIVNSEINKYFNKGDSIEQIIKLPLDVLKQKQPCTLNNYINLVKIQKRTGLVDNNRETMLAYDTTSQENINLIIESYKLDPNKTVAYIDNCINYQGMTLLESLNFYKGYIFKSHLLNGKNIDLYPEGLKSAYYSISKDLSVTKKIKYTLIWDSKDDVLKQFIKSGKLTLQFNNLPRNSRYTFKITGIRTAVFLEQGMYYNYNPDSFTKTVLYAKEESNLLNFYLREYRFKSRFNEDFPILEVTQSSEDRLILSINEHSEVLKCLDDHIIMGAHSLLDIESISKMPHVNKIPFKEILEHSNFNTLMEYLQSYTAYEPLIRRGFFKIFSRNIHYLRHIPAQDNVKKTLYFLNKSQMDYVLSIEGFSFEALLRLKTIYDNINYIDQEIIDEVIDPALTQLNLSRLFEEIHQTKETLKATFTYLKEKTDQYFIVNNGRDDVFTLYYDYLMTCRLMEVKPERFPKDIFKAHDTMMSIYQVKKDEIKEKRMKELSEQLKELEYEDEEYAIVVPKSTQDLVDEGAKLSHCVSTYIDRVIERKTTIFLVRKKDNKEEPYFTLEIVKGMKNQLRGKYNCQPTEEVSKFTDEWISKNADKLRAI